MGLFVADRDVWGPDGVRFRAPRVRRGDVLCIYYGEARKMQLGAGVGGAMSGSQDSLGESPAGSDEDNNANDGGGKGEEDVKISVDNNTDYTLGGFGLYSVDASKHIWCLARYINDNSVRVGPEANYRVSDEGMQSTAPTSGVPLLQAVSKEQSKETAESGGSKEDTYDVNAAPGASMRERAAASSTRKSMFNQGRRGSKEDEERLRMLMNIREPNVKFVKSRRSRTALVVATRDIGVGEELFVAYGAGYWRKRGVAIGGADTFASSSSS